MQDPLNKALLALPYDIDDEGKACYSDDDVPDTFENDFDEDDEIDSDEYHTDNIDEEMEF